MDAVAKNRMDGARLLDLGAAAEGLSSGGAFWLAMLAFIGTISFCTIQAIVAPRSTFCAQQMPEPQLKVK